MSKGYGHFFDFNALCIVFILVVYPIFVKIKFLL